MITFLIFLLYLLGSPVFGALIVAVIYIVIPCKLSGTEGPEPIFHLGIIGVTVLLALFFLAVGGWVTLPFFTFVIGGFVTVPLCYKYAEPIDDLKAFLWTPQKAGKRKEVPCYPKAEPMPVPVEEESMAMMYYSRD